MLTAILKKIALAAILAPLALAASATTVTVSQGLTLDNVYGSNSTKITYSSSFDAAAALGTSNFSGSYVVNSATISFAWTDNSDSYSLVSSSGWSRSYGSYRLTNSSCTGWLIEWCDYTYHRPERGSNTEQYSTPSESAAVAFGTTIVPSAATSVASTKSTSSLSNSVVYEYSTRECGIFCLGGYDSHFYTDYHDTTTSVYTDYSGRFSLMTDLGALTGAEVASFLSTGVLPFSMTMNGDAYLTGATLTLDVTPVPEPESYAMLLAGLGVMGFIKRRLRTGCA